MLVSDAMAASSLSLGPRALCSLGLITVQAVLSKIIITVNNTHAHSSIELKCLSTVHVTSYEWFKENVSATYFYKLSKDNTTIYIPDAVYDDCGVYRCVTRDHGHIAAQEFNLIIDGILPFEYKIISVAIIGLGCMLTSVSAFMLSTVFRYTDKIAQTSLIVLCLLFLMTSLIMLLTSTILWIAVDGLPILIALFVHLTIITTVIVIMRKYQYSEEGCASEMPLIHRLLVALGSPFALCTLVFIYKKITDIIRDYQLQSLAQEEEEESEGEPEREESEPTLA
ncbi:uncharacterized protein LOC116990090 isoform X4 [Amblyraja radiata]|uniref:uncharacterized protein LOC116990090 isoform X4 n=1 Tax=Amblyraja radiata TaxID=386614 RepID=UPI00140422B2|nr:uncharacterized protein LOC116990090 isoform X4 [Amblyraja radiata]